MTIAKKQDSSLTGLRYCVETSLGVLPAAASQIWYPAEPNTYSDFGGTIKTIARQPINVSRQNHKGVTADVDAAAGYNTDMTATNLLRLMQGFMFADAREPYDSQSLNAAAIADIAVTNSSHEYTSAAFGLTGKHMLVNSMILVSGSANAVSNGLKIVSTITADTTIIVTDTAPLDESANPNIRIQTVGYEFASGSASIVAAANPTLHRASGAVDFTTLGLVPGQWVYIGGDSAGLAFATAANNGYARVKAVTATDITFDKTTSLMVNDAGTSKTVQVFWGKVIKNEATSALIKRRSFALERDLGQLDSTNAAHQGEYVNGAVPNQFTLTVKQADKLTADLTFMGLTYSTVAQSSGLLSTAAVSAGSAANAPTIVSEDAFNTSADVARLRLSAVDATTANAAQYFAYMTDLSVVINNNVTVDKAVGVLGGFETSAGQFDVSGKVTAYFADIASIAAVQANANCTIDGVFAHENVGILFDMPLVGLGDGKLAVAENTPITLPLTTVAAADPFYNHTLLLEFFGYLPAAAM